MPWSRFRKLPILEDVADAEAVVSSAAMQPRGRLRINAPLSFGILHLAPLWPRFMTRYPDIEHEISLVDRLVDLVEEGYDLAIRISRGGSSTLVSRKLATARHMICASPAYIVRHGAPQVPQDLSHHACIAYTHSALANEWQLFDDADKVQSVPVSNVLQTNNGDTARAAALAGLGIILQPTFLIGEDVRHGRLLRLLPDYRAHDIDILAVYPSRRHVSAKVRVMIDFLVEAFQGPLPWDLKGT